jgi:hypothetical protein
VAHVGTELTPLSRRSAIGELDQVEDILDIRVESLASSVDVSALRIVAVLELAGEADADDRERLGADVLTEEEELVETETVGLIVVREVAVLESIVPAVLVERTVLYRADAILPLVASSEIRALDDTAAREAEDARVEVGESLSEVGPKTILAAFPRLGREERDMLEVDSVTLEEDAEDALLDTLVRLDSCRVLLPVLAVDV